MAESIDEDNSGNGGRDDGVDEEVNDVEDGENGEEYVKEGDDEEDDDKGSPQRAWKEAARLYGEAVAETKVAIDRIIGCGGLRGQLVLFEAALRNVEFNVEMWEEESLPGVFSQERLALLERLVRDCDAALNGILLELREINENDERRVIHDNGNLVFVGENGDRVVINDETNNPFKERNFFLKSITRTLFTVRQFYLPDIYQSD